MGPYMNSVFDTFGNVGGGSNPGGPIENWLWDDVVPNIDTDIAPKSRVGNDEISCEE